MIVRRQVEGFHRGTQAGVETFIDGPLGQMTDAIFAAQQACLDGFPIVADWREAGHAGHCHATPQTVGAMSVMMHQHSPPLTPITWRVM